MSYKLLTEFEGLFKGHRYKHRISTLGDHVAGFLYEDLVDLGRSSKLVQRTQSHERVLNKKNKTIGKKARRGDGTFGERVPSVAPVSYAGLHVAVGEVATVEIGAEVKILAKAMIKQIDRVCTDMRNQVLEFQKHGGNPICVAIVGINHAASYTSYEKNKKWPTLGTGGYRHPIQEAGEAEKRIMQHVSPHFLETIILRFVATNVPPYPFQWLATAATEREYSAALVRISIEYEKRF